MSQVIFLDREFQHHGRFSGYKQIVNYINGTVYQVRDWLAWLPEKPSYRWLGLHPLWYNRKAFELELGLFQLFALHNGIICHYLYGEASFKLGGRLNRRLGYRNRLVATYHQLPQFFEQRRAQLSHLGDLDAVVLVSNSQRSVFASIVPVERVHVVPHGVDTQFFNPSNSSTQGRPLRCLTVGSNYRDFDAHLRMIKDVNRSSKRGMDFVVIGEAQYVEYFADLEHVRYFSGISDEELRAQYQAADVLVLPLTDATACNALLEGMACGLPIVVTDVGGVRDYVDDECAVLTDVEHMTEAVLALEHDTDWRVRLGKMARAKAVDQFDWQVIATQINQVYSQLW